MRLGALFASGNIYWPMWKKTGNSRSLSNEIKVHSGGLCEKVLLPQPGAADITRYQSGYWSHSATTCCGIGELFPHVQLICRELHRSRSVNRLHSHPKRVRFIHTNHTYYRSGVFPAGEPVKDHFPQLVFPQIYCALGLWRAVIVLCVLSLALFLAISQ